MKIGVLEHWDDMLTRLPAGRSDVYFSEGYIRLYENDAEKAACFVYEQNKDLFLFPFLSRSFVFCGQVYYDFETAYGYGGPVCSTSDPGFLCDAWCALKRFFSSSGYVAGFVRFHPLLDNQCGFEVAGRLIADRKTVAMDLNRPMDDVWQHEIHSKNRNMIRKAEKSNLRFAAEDGYEHLPDFVRLYDGTMDKLSADGFYYFNWNYYLRLKQNIPNSFLGCVFKDKTLVSAAIFMYEGPYGHYHLSGSDPTYLNLSPNNFLLWRAAAELQRRGVRQFHLGGGSNPDEDNSLFLFKRRFSQSTRQFYIGKLIFDEAVYSAVCSSWEKENPDKAERYAHHLLKYKY